MSYSSLMIRLLKFGFPFRFTLAKLTKFPFLGFLIRRYLFHRDDILYLPGNTVVEVNHRIRKPPSMVCPNTVVDTFILRANYLWIMDRCICRLASNCRDYPQDLGCLFLGDAVLGINPKLGKLVSKQEALQHVGKCREAGLVHLIGRNKLDTVWLNIGPGTRLLTICHCCPCCCLWKMLPNLSSRISGSVTRMPGVHVKVTEKCTGCGTCTNGICFVNAIRLENGKAVIKNGCRGCGRCVAVCPQDAIKITIDDFTDIDATVNRIHHLVDVT
ncbi:4Fe-4S binding protein [candidate division KSB1 bacterium]|nr:4Fe-4S binding protein [candidate division KSB1 bacterium]